MNINIIYTVAAAAAFVMVFISGFRLRISGKPYKSMIFNLHKLLAVAALVLLILIVRNINASANLNSFELVVCSISGLIFLITIITGGMMSIYKTAPPPVEMMHKVFPYLTVLSSTSTLLLILLGL